MKFHSIENSDQKISQIGLGTWVFGGSFWGGTQEDDSIEAVHAALDEGINLIDTAPVYGDGKSEEIVGKAIRSRRKDVFLATKCGLITKGKDMIVDLSAKSVQKEIDESLSRLDCDYIDLYQCHWPDDKTEIQETMDVMVKLKGEGKIRHIGVSNYDKKQLSDVKACTEILTLQSQYSLLDKTLDRDILPYCGGEKISLLAYGSLAGGILSGKYTKEPQFKGPDARSFFYKYYKGKSFKETQDIIVKLQTIKRPLSQVAINFVRQKEGVLSVLVGCRNKDQLQENVQAVD